MYMYELFSSLRLQRLKIVDIDIDIENINSLREFAVKYVERTADQGLKD